MNRNEKMRIGMNSDCGLRIAECEGIRNSDCGIRNESAQHCSAVIPQSAIRNPHSPRRGILLLVVLSMLTLFLLIGTAFIVSANHFRRSMKIQAGVTQTSNSSIDQGRLLDEVINQLVRDTNNQNSSLRFHSLLRDMYGNDGIFGEIGVVEWADENSGPGALNPTNGQMLQFRLNAANATDQFGNPLPTFSPNNYAYNGLVLTFLNGPARGQSARIVWHGPLDPVPPVPAVFDARLRVLTPRLANGSVITTPSNLNGSRIAINGRPFNGTGVGYDVGAPAGGARLTATENVFGTARPLSLLPNSSFQSLLLDTGSYSDQEISDLRASISDDYYFSSFTTARLTALGINGNSKAENLEAIRLKNLIGTPGQGGSDESYDAVDFQNMALGLMPSNPAELLPATIGSGVLEDTGGVLPIPSFHRPALINYWANQNALFHTPSGTREFEPNMLRKVLLRPSWMGHPNFTGSNPEFSNLLAAYQNNPTGTVLQDNLLNSMIYGPWDVDNDNDGVRDSVWVDFGAPVRENSDGKLVKPLAAILVLDMDGRLNINAHGSRDIAGMTTLPPGQSIAGGANTNDLPRGQGYGPAEISLEPLMDLGTGGTLTPAQKRAWYQRFFAGVAASDTLMPTDTSSRVIARSRVGKMGGSDAFPGQLGFDLAAQVKMQGMPGWANGEVFDSSGAQVLGGYATMPDLHGRYGIGLNDLGQPVTGAIQDYTTNGTRIDQNSPYELDLSLGAARGESTSADDSPYSMAEMERILRSYDPDAGTLPSRIWEFAGEFKPTATATTPNLDNLNRWRASLTTDSYDLPVPNVVVPGWMRANFQAVMGRPPVGVSFADLLEYRFRIVPPIFPTANDHLPKSAVRLRHIRREMRKLLPPDLADGLRLDINRPFGNGRDDNNNGVVDEPGEDDGTGTEAPYWASANDPGNKLAAFKDSTTGQFRDAVDRDGDGFITTDYELGQGDIDGNGTTDVNDLVFLHNLRRQMLARDLYVLALTLADPFDLTTTAGKAKTRKLAQWAINVVDFRDPDNIMTAFEYDANPFDGWGSTVDPVDGIPNATYPATNQTQLVWGVERPELLITETLAWHDRQTTDSANEVAAIGEERGTVDEGKDEDYDQRNSPRGYGFIELYNPWPENPATNNDTYGTDTAGVFGVDLARVTPVGIGPDPDPVWRMVVYKNGGASKDPDDPDTDNHPRHFAFSNLVDRSLYFTHLPFVTNPTRSFGNDGVAFYNDVSAAPPAPPVMPIPAGGYMVVGGAEKQGTTNNYLAIFGEDIVTGEERGILLNTATNSISVTVQSDATTAVQDADGFSMVANNVAVANSVSIAIINSPRRFSFSEPAHGYPNLFGGVRDIPFDNERIFQANAINANGQVGGGTAKLGDGETRLTLPATPTGGRTIPGFSWIYLQRLANPLQPWDAEVNPYRTVDASGANVTVFNGLDKREMRQLTGGALEKFANFEAIEGFASLQRGRSNKPTSTGDNMLGLQNAARGAQSPSNIVPPLEVSNLWNYETIGSADGAPFGGFWKNQAGPNSRGDDANSNQYNFEGIPDCTLGFLNEPFRAAGAVTERETKREPAQPFPWITWNNRPFANAGEIMQVPAFRSSQLLQVFSNKMTAPSTDPLTMRTSAENYDGNVTELALSTTLTLETDGPYGHLLNFFRTEMGGGANDEGIAGLHRMLDYIHVPSPFVKTETWLNPVSFGNTNVTSVDDPRYLRQPPFNRIAEYRDPGRVNVNTVVNEEVYFGLMHGDPGTGANDVHPGPTWGSLVDSRRGFGVANPILQLNSDIPTFFANPLRSSDASQLVPLGPANGPSDMTQENVNCTILREGAASNVPLFAAATNNAYNNVDRNPYFRYQPMTRLSSMTTTRSNVYAVWVTVGFFEVEEVDRTRDQFADDNGFGATATAVSNALYDKVYPEGYQLGEEAGSETGDIRRVREFAMIDRTVPVAFQPGKNHNVDKAIRLRRRIE